MSDREHAVQLPLPGFEEFIVTPEASALHEDTLSVPPPYNPKLSRIKRKLKPRRQDTPTSP